MTLRDDTGDKAASTKPPSNVIPSACARDRLDRSRIQEELPKQCLFGRWWGGGETRARGHECYIYQMQNLTVSDASRLLGGSGCWTQRGWRCPPHNWLHLTCQLGGAAQLQINKTCLERFAHPNLIQSHRRSHTHQPLRPGRRWDWR